MGTRLAEWLRDQRAIWRELGRLQHEAKALANSTSLYGRLGEMGHPEDRADDWPGADTGVLPLPRDPTIPSH